MSQTNGAKIHPLRQRLMELGKTQSQFAEEIGVKRASVSEYINGGCFRPKRVRAMAVSLECTPKEVVQLFTHPGQ
jgi:transcriptional regulator with XRE-family HTH domain